jgi:hypothetical protein
MDSNFRNDEKMKDMQWYHNTVKAFDQMNSVD